ncbi:radical SAM protein [Ruminiclostridium josui]|uniref:radical SAM protein n=1 Tax=Ruminiclostridium josui TaxID=1499 RepID=UPI000466A4F8|nr:radical SAM protein [Ruminiclostridium josui]
MNVKEHISQEVYKYIQYFNSLNKGEKPLAKLFRTSSNDYIYDSGTGKVLECNKVEYKVLEAILKNNIEQELCKLQEQLGEKELIDACENVKYAIENEKILQLTRYNEFYSPLHFDDIESKINGNLRQIILELTERCNLRCGYCIYNPDYEQKRDFGQRDMSEETIRAAIDYIAEHGKNEKTVAVTFYGGEPLLRFDLLKYSIDYSREVIKDREITYSLTTNLTLVTKDIAEYLASIEGLSVVCSLDGPENIHDSYRKDINGNGSFSRAIRGLKNIVEAFGDSAEHRLSLSMVFTPPYSTGKLTEIEKFIEGLDWFPKKMAKSVSYPSEGSVADERRYHFMDTEYVEYQNDLLEIKADYTMSRWSREKYLNQILNNQEADFFTKKGIEEMLLRIQRRTLVDKPSDKIGFNGNCLPGQRRLYVNIDGDFLVCEKVGGAITIGNVFTGIDIDRIRSVYIEQYAEESLKYCSKCWAARMCGICYSSCYTNDQLDMKKKIMTCEITRKNILEGLILYHECVEKNPEKLKYLNDLQVL